MAAPVIATDARRAITTRHQATTASTGLRNYGAGPGYGYYRSPPAWFENDTDRGGPGPRVGAGSGMGVGSQR